MSSEIVWVDGDTGNLLVILRRNPPDSTHYYYFPGEISPIKIVKWVDVEPVRRHSAQIHGVDHMIFLSRIHFWGLVLWIDPPPLTPDGRPVCVFDMNFHTPYFIMQNSNWVQEDNVKDASSLSWVDKGELFIAIKYFTPRIMSVSSTNPQPYPAILQETKQEAIADPKTRFDLSSILSAAHTLLFVGAKPNVSSVRDALKDSSGDITKASLKSFLKQIGVQ
jgi:hypothetical protein